MLCLPTALPLEVRMPQCGLVLCALPRRPSPISTGTSNSSCFRLLSLAGDRRHPDSRTPVTLADPRVILHHLPGDLPLGCHYSVTDFCYEGGWDALLSPLTMPLPIFLKADFSHIFSRHACLPRAFTWLQYPQPLWRHPLSDPTTSLDSHHLLPLVASQIIPTPGYPVSTLPDPVNPQVWDISTLVIDHHHQPVLVLPKDTSSFPFKTPAPHFWDPSLPSQAHHYPLPVSGTSNPDSACNPSFSLARTPPVPTAYFRTSVIPLGNCPVVTNLDTFHSNMPPTNSDFTILDL